MTVVVFFLNAMACFKQQQKKAFDVATCCFKFIITLIFFYCSFTILLKYIFFSPFLDNFFSTKWKLLLIKECNLVSRKKNWFFFTWNLRSKYFTNGPNSLLILCYKFYFPFNVKLCCFFFCPCCFFPQISFHRLLHSLLSNYNFATSRILIYGNSWVPL